MAEENMSTAMVVAPQQQEISKPIDELTNVQRIARMFVASGFFQDTRDLAQAGVKIMAGAELGIPPVASMMGIHVIKGKVAMGATLIASRVRAHGYDFKVTRLDGTGCVISFYGKPAGAEFKRPFIGESSFTEEDARAAKIESEMYRKFPRNMYYSRAISNGARWYTPEVFGGSPVYTPDELGAEVNEDGEFRSAPSPSAPTSAPQPSEEAEVVTQPAVSPTPQPTPAPVPNADWNAMGDEIPRSEGKLPLFEPPSPRFPVAAAKPAENGSATQTAVIDISPDSPEAILGYAREKFIKSSTAERVTLFNMAKARFQKMLGKDEGETRYQDWLSAAEVAKPSDFKSMKPALECYAQMLGQLMDLEARDGV